MLLSISFIQHQYERQTMSFSFINFLQDQKVLNVSPGQSIATTTRIANPPTFSKQLSDIPDTTPVRSRADRGAGCGCNMIVMQTVPRSLMEIRA